MSPHVFAVAVALATMTFQAPVRAAERAPDGIYVIGALHALHEEAGDIAHRGRSAPVLERRHEGIGIDQGNSDDARAASKRSKPVPNTPVKMAE